MLGDRVTLRLGLVYEVESAPPRVGRRLWELTRFIRWHAVYHCNELQWPRPLPEDLNSVLLTVRFYRFEG